MISTDQREIREAIQFRWSSIYSRPEVSIERLLHFFSISTLLHCPHHHQPVAWRHVLLHRLLIRPAASRQKSLWVKIYWQFINSIGHASPLNIYAYVPDTRRPKPFSSSTFSIISHSRLLKNVNIMTCPQHLMARNLIVLFDLWGSCPSTKL